MPAVQFPPVPPLPETVPPAAAPLVGGYRLGELIGRGSIGDVHVATEPITGQQVAMKLLRPASDASSDERSLARQRFLAEAETARLLNHPDVVRVLAAGDDHGRAWMAMELLGGCDLERYTRPARLLPEPVVLRLAERLARALAYAHSRGVVHRDVKPANVLVDWSSGRVTLTDFGIARAAGAESTRTGIVLGTPVYMAPEQLAGGQADVRGDLYALGVLLFQLLTGRLPHESHSLGDLLRQVANEPAPDLRQVRPDLPAVLADLVAQLLDKSPARRPRDAQAVADALAQVAAALPVPPAHSGPMSRG